MPAALVPFFLPGPAAADEALTLAISPYLASIELIKRFTPFADMLGAGLGRKVIVKISRDYQDQIDLVGADKCDMAYMGPMSYVKMVDTYGPKRILARLEVNGQPGFRGAIIVSADSGLSSLKELKGKSFAFGDPNSTMSHLVPRYMLWQAGVGVEALSKYSFMGNHHNVALSVLMGDYDAGAVKEEIFYKYKHQGLKVIAWSPEVPEHMFVATGRVEPGVARKIQTIMRGLGATEEGRAVMRSVKQTVTGLAPAEDSDYAGLREILNSYTQLVARK